MSRPIYEPSLPRADAAQAWGSRQLFRRPSPTPAEFEESKRHWALAYNNTPILRGAGSAATKVASFASGFVDSAAGFLSLDGNNKIRISSPGAYWCHAKIGFGVGGVSTGTAISARVQMRYDWGVAGGSPHDWRWLYRIIGGAGEGQGDGPSMTVWRGGGSIPPYGDPAPPPSMAVEEGGTQAGTVNGMLVVSRINGSVPMEFIIDNVRAAAGTFTGDAFYHSIAVMYMGIPNSLAGAVPPYI